MQTSQCSKQFVWAQTWPEGGNYMVKCALKNTMKNLHAYLLHKIQLDGGKERNKIITRTGPEPTKN